MVLKGKHNLFGKDSPPPRSTFHLYILFYKFLGLKPLLQEIRLIFSLFRLIRINWDSFLCDPKSFLFYL